MGGKHNSEVVEKEDKYGEVNPKSRDAGSNSNSTNQNNILLFVSKLYFLAKLELAR